MRYARELAWHSGELMRYADELIWRARELT